MPAVIPLTATPGLGHLRRALLDQRHYNWDTAADRPTPWRAGTIGEKKTPGCLRLRLTDPTKQRFDPVELDVNLFGGRIGVVGSGRSVAVTDYVLPKLRSYFATIVNVTRLTYDERSSGD